MSDNIRWAHVLKSLLPPGKLFDQMETPPEPGSGPLIWRLLKAFAVELARLEVRILQALAEMDPRTANETIGDWERAFGLPDVRVPVLPTGLAQRRAVVIAKLVSRGAQTEAAYTALVEACGWELIAVRKAWTVRPLNCRSFCTARHTGLKWANTVEFLVGGETLDSLSLADLRRVLQHTLQLHAYALVTYVP